MIFEEDSTTHFTMKIQVELKYLLKQALLLGHIEKRNLVTKITLDWREQVSLHCDNIPNDYN